MVGQYAQGQSAYSAAKYQQAGAAANAQLANDQAKAEIDNTKLAAQRRYREASQLEGNQRAAMAANGIDLNYGSAVDVLRDDKMIAAEDVGQIYKEGFNKTQGYLIDAYNERLKGSAARSAAHGAQWATGIGMLGTALGSASQISKMNAAAKFG
jgi:hypothetical protein